MIRRLARCAAALAAAAFVYAAAPAAALPNNSFPPNGDTQMCSGRPWIDVLCYGADPTHTTDSAAAINDAVAAALAAGVPVHIPAGNYKVLSEIGIDTTGFGTGGFRLISENATLDMTSIASGLVLSIKRTGGTPSVPAVDQNFTIDGALTINANVAGYAVQFGRSDFSDEFLYPRIAHLVVNNASTSAAAGGLEVNYVVGGNLWVEGTTAGGAASVAAVALEQVQNSTIGGAGAAGGASAPSLLIENGTSTGDMIAGFDYGSVSNTCLSITTASAARNSFVAPSLGCTTGINATSAGTGNILLGPTFTGTNLGPLSGGIAMVGRGSLNRFSEPAVSSYTAVGSDDGNILSSGAGTGAATGWSASSLPVTLPAPSAVGAGWTMGFTTDGGKAIVLSIPSGAIRGPGGQSVTSLTMGPGNGESLVLQSDGGSYFRILYISPSSALYNGLSTGFPTEWVYPASTGFAATLGNNGQWLSSELAGGTMTITLPPTTAIPVGWTIGALADTNDVIFQVNGTSGGLIKTSAGSTVSSLDIGNFTESRAVLLFDGARFREITEASQGAITGNMIASGAVAAALGYTPVNPAQADLIGSVHLGGTFPVLYWEGANGWWNSAMDQAQPIPFSDFVIADKCLTLPLGSSGSCADVVDQIVDNNNQIGVAAYAVVNGGASYVTGDTVTFGMGCQVNPTGVVTASGGVVSAVTPFVQGGYGRCTIAPSGTQSQLSTSGSGAGLTVTPTTVNNMPTLGVGGYVGAYGFEPDASMYALTVSGFASQPLVGDLMLEWNGINTGLMLDVFNKLTGATMLGIDNAGNLWGRGYIELKEPVTRPDFSHGQGILYPDSLLGMVLTGLGTNYDVSLMSSAGSAALAVLTGTSNILIGHGGLIVGSGSGVSNGQVDASDGFSVNGTPGLSCSGTPSSSFATDLGIVTHC